MNPDGTPQVSDRNWLEKTKDYATKALIIIAAVILVVLGCWAIIIVVPKAIDGVKNGFSSVFQAKESISLDSNLHTVVSGQPVTLTWDHKERKVSGTYAISFACAPGLGVKIQNGPTIPCERTIAVGDVKSITLVASTTINRLVEIPASVYFIPAGNTAPTVTAATTLTITNDTLPFTDATGSSTPAVIYTNPATGGTVTGPKVTTTTAVTKPVTTTSNVSTAPAAPVYRGPADLSATLLSSAADSIRFRVSNIGGTASGAWTFSTNIPTSNGGVYGSPVEPSIGPGSGIIFTLSYGASSLNGSNAVTITVDPSNYVIDANRSNNTLTIPNYGGSAYYGGTGYNGTVYNNYGTGLPDLAAQILSVDGNASANSSYNYNYSNAAHTIQVQVTNIGGTASGNWNYTAILPIADCQNTQYGNTYSANAGYQNYGYQSSGYITCNGSQAVWNGQSQTSLAAGQNAIVTISFNTPTYNGYQNQNGYQQYGANQTFSFTVDPNNYIQESNKGNNTATTFVRTY